MQPIMKPSGPANDLFADHKFANQYVEQEFASITNSRGDRIRLMVVVYPLRDRLSYRVDSRNGTSMYYYLEFAKALQGFREMIQ